ncbi:MAG: pyridoxal phosphate-dependent aminotransferase [Firmicutes bacterium]|nr:pyridoxal phosphate-dependent aminotransferase [Bacillota bacterium]
MQVSAKAMACGLSPMRKFNPYEAEAVKKGRKVYHLNIGQPDIPTPAVAMEAVRNYGEQVLAYAPSAGVPQLINAVRDYYARLGVQYGPKDIYITAGGSEALYFVMLSILDEGCEVIVPEPYYPNYNTFISSAGGKICPLPTSAEEGYHFADKARIEALINDKTRAILYSNPGNPTGAILSKEDLRVLADVAKEHNLYLISDEVYREFVYGGEELTSIAQFDDIDDNAVVIDSTSKRFSACGARIGMAITKNELLQQQLNKFCQGRLATAVLEQIAAAALYGLDASYFDVVREEYKHRREICYQKLMEIPGVVCREPKGAFYLMPQLPIDDCEKFQIWLLEEFEDNGETLMFAPGTGFYANPEDGKTQVRLAYVLKAEDLERAMEILKIAIEKYNAR